MKWIGSLKRAWWRCVAGAVLISSVIGVSAFTSSDATTMMNAFNTRFYFTSNGGTSFRNTTDGGEVWFWGRANQMEMLIDAYERTTNSAYLNQFTNMYNGFVADYQSNWIWNEFNDDIMWMVIACARAYQKTGNTTFRNAAKNNFDSCYARAWSSDLGGGLWWKSPLNTSKNACVNGPAAIAAYLLYEIYGDTNYLNKAHEIFLWERATLVNTNTGQVFDSIHISGNKDQTPITYNQGTYIGAAHLLGYTNEAMLAANYVKNNMTSAGGVLPQYDEDNDLGGFNGIFLRWMSKFMRERGLESEFQPFLQQNANAAFNMRRLSDNLSWSKWRQSTPTGTRYSFGCWGSVLAMHVVPPTQIPNAPSVMLLASDAVGTSSFVSGLNWSNNIVPWASNNFVVSGLELRTPANGSHHQFMGGSLTVSNGGVLRLMGTTGGRVITVGTELNLADGTVVAGSGQSLELAGWVNLKSGSGIFDPQATTLTLGAPVVGPGTLTLATMNTTINGTLVLNCINSHTGGTLLNAQHTLRLGTGTIGPANGTLMFSNTINRGFGIVDMAGRNMDIGNLIGTGGRILNNNSSTNAVLTIGNGNTGGGVFLGNINDRMLGSGTVSLVKRGAGTITLAGANTYTGGTIIEAGVLQLGDGATRNGTMLGAITNNAHLVFANPFSMAYAGTISGAGRVTKRGAGLLSLPAAQTFTGGLLIEEGTVQVGDSGAQPGGLVGNVTNHSVLIFSSSQAQSFSGTLRGSGSLTKSGVGRLTLSGINLCSGDTVVQIGTLAISNTATLNSSATIVLGAAGTIDALGRPDRTLALISGQRLTGSGTINGKLAAGAASRVEPGQNGLGTLTVLSNVTLSGVLEIELNRNQAVPNDRLTASGSITGGGTLTVTNMGAALQAGDRFEIFNKPVSGFAAVNLPPLDAGLDWTNKLAIDGSVEVIATVSLIPAPIQFTRAGSDLELAWPEDHIGWRLQRQAGSLAEGLGTNWIDVPDSIGTNRMLLPIDSGDESVFFRLVYP